MTPHHHATEWRGQSGDEKAVILARDRAAHRTRGITAKAVGHDPFAIEQDFARTVRAVPMHRAQRHSSSSTSLGPSTTAHSSGMRQFFFESSGGGSPAPP